MNLVNPRSATVEAATDCRLLALAPETVAELRREFPEFARLLEERRAQYHKDREARMPLDFVSAEALPAEATVTAAPGPVDVSDPTDAPTGSDATEVSEDVDARFADERGLFRKRPGRLRRFVVLEQIDEMDCGAASLGMVCRHFGRKVSLARIRQLCHTSHDGTSLKALVHAATELGLAARAVKVSLHRPVAARAHHRCAGGFAGRRAQGWGQAWGCPRVRPGGWRRQTAMSASTSGGLDSMKGRSVP